MDFQEYDKVFTPGAPMADPRFFFGREQEIADLQRCLKRKGLNPIVIGHRGVGKTSLVSFALRQTPLKECLVTCNSQMSFDRFAHAVLREIGLNERLVERSRESSVEASAKAMPLGVGASVKGEQREYLKEQGLASLRLDPWTLFSEIQRLNPNIAVVIDEYDAIPRGATNFHSWIAGVIKTFADHSNTCETRIVVVGVAHTAQALLGEHESIERSAREVYVRTLRREDIYDFLHAAESELGFSFDSGVRDNLVWSSMGYPYFVHLVGLDSLDAMVQRDPNARKVEPEDYAQGLKRAVQEAYRSELRKYREGVQGLTDKEVALIRELARSPEQKQVPRHDLMAVLLRKSIMTAGEFSSALVKLTQERHILYVSRNRDAIRFSDPLMAPFLRATIYRPPQSDETASRQLHMFDAEADA